MSQKTIRAQLVAPESSRQAIWELMAKRNTPLINALLEQIAASPDFEEACSKSGISQATVKDCCQKLRADPQFSGQPGRFYTSAILTVSRIFKSWIRIRSQILYRLEGQTRWLLILQSDEELTQACGCNLEAIQNKAAEVLALVVRKTPETQ